MKRFLLSTVILAGLGANAFAANPAEGDKLADKQEYTYWLLDAIKTLDPQKNTDVEGSDAIRSLFEGLLNEDAKGAMVPGVAESYTVSDDKKVYTFKLRDAAKWSNGDPVTAGDFVYAWQRAVNPETASEYAWFMELMNIVNATEIVKGDMAPTELGVKALDDHTLEVTLTQPTPYFPKMLSHATTYPVPQKVIEQFGDQWTQPGNLVGNGAFTLQSHDLGVQLTMVPNPNYWDNEHTILTKVQAVTVNDVNIALTRYLAGELDRVDIPAGQYPRLSAEYPDQAVSTPYACSYGYLFNLSDKGPEALKDVRVRKALAYAMNRDIVVNQILQGGQHPAYNWTHWAIEGFVMPKLAYAEMTQEDRVAKAKEMLAEAGYGPDNPLKLQLQYNTSEDHKKIAVAAQQFWKQIGVDVTLNNVEWKVHTDRMQSGDFELARYAWCGDYNEASTFLDYFRTDGLNYGKFSNAEYDDLLAKSKTSENPNEQYTRAEEIIAEENPLVTVYHYANVDMIRDDVKGAPLENVMNTWYAKDIYRVAK